MRFTILLVLATTTLVAGDSVISLFIPDTDPQPLVASIVAQNSATTSLSVNCPSSTKSEICGMGPGLFLTTAPTSVEYLISDSAGSIYDHVVCFMTGTTSGVCTATITGHGANFPGTSTSTLNQDQITSLPVTVIAGPSNSMATTTSASPRNGPIPATSVTSSTGHGMASSTHATTHSTSGNSQTGGIALMTGSSELMFIGGAVAFIAGL
ncbi:hypothetical protein MYU51_020293 [Penicillium brevicompactum]|uniref:uncharacterized protein n=1 Tax=Penicillium brevicompactum TaxID=5074 RepID=UPI002540ACD1|nr:uncharacterized protein N7506_003916 [Penicillium brevicompactum]KAJ5335894.1 hypothetical protein N7506_003916 [Penicillium brevicompactum]